MSNVIEFNELQSFYFEMRKQLDIKNKAAKLVRVPKFADIPYPTIMEPKLVIEYYSR